VKISQTAILRIVVASVLLAEGITAFSASEPATADANSSAQGLAELQKALSSTTNVLTGFVQEKQMAMLKNRVIIKGQLAVQQPDFFAWHVSEPIRYNLILKGSTLQQWDEVTGKEQKMSLANNPVFEIVSRQLKAWFGGQFEALLRDFDARMDPAAVRRVLLTPNSESFARKAIKQIAITFREDRRYLEKILIEETGGDTTLMTFTNTVLNTTIDQAAWEVKQHGR